MLGPILIAVGTAVAFAVRVASFSRYIHLEDLGPDVDSAFGTELYSQIAAPAMAEKTIFYPSVALVPIGLLLLVLPWRRSSLAGR